MPLETRDHKKFAGVVGGKISVKAVEGAEGAIKREYETSTGQKGVKWEYIYDNLRGKIEDIAIVEGDFGDQLQVTIDGITFSVGTASKYGLDFMKKLPNINLEEEINLVPYSMETEGKTKSGLVIYQGRDEKEGKAIKLQDFFFNWETKISLHDFPMPQKDMKDMDKDDWKVYFIEMKKFLVNYTVKNIIPKFEKLSSEIPVMEAETEEEGINIDDIDFGETKK